MEFEEYVAARGVALRRFAYVLTADPHAAEDLVQSGLADAYRHWRKVQRADHPDAYVRRMMLNRHLSWRRRLASREVVSAELPEPPPRSDSADALASADEAWRLLALLPAKARTVLALRYFEDLDDAAIAQALGVAESTVRSTASRALKSLRSQMQEPLSPELKGPR